ncbi:hypothetical protein [Thiocapsa marina]|uniref:Haemin-degrading HemS/ChuX domain-containing protein n=1 Tax=Thiocapsa marina 5811 TaxID=768671 RepID=F9UGQ9_9GAMM|nr:hypothetical protein [Thiocapsa marina]EGV16529.1 hypothetical protein ThimaDRAFT_4112 [Thiocapsa marina 5811]
MPPYIELENMPSAAVIPALSPRPQLEQGLTARNVHSWTVFLGELVAAGRIRIGTSLPAVTLEHHGNWPGIHIEDSFGIASGCRFTLRMALDRWSEIDRSKMDAVGRDRHSDVSILGRDGAPVLDLGFGEDHNGIASDVPARYAARCRTPSWSEPAPKRNGDAEALDHDPARGWAASPGNAADVVDPDEAMGQLLLSPERLRERGCFSTVDAALVPCFLEALAEQALPIRIDTGTAGVAHSLDCTFFCHRREGAWQTLKSDSARFRIDTSKIDSAWVLTVSQAAREHSSLRLYDTRGRLLAKIGAVPGFVAIENPIWRTLVNALQD